VAPTHVLVALDGSPLANEALDYAVETFDCRITVLNVVKPLDGTMSEGSEFPVGRDRDRDPDRVEAATERATELVEAARERAAPAAGPVETVVEVGDPSEAILAYAEHNDVDHIVLGGHGGEGGELRRRLLGTVSTAVLGGASVTTTVVR
jgi:nucleotide-binding universal stress UspA family protein